MDDKREAELHKKINSGELYDCYNEELIRYMFAAADRLNDYNATRDNLEGFQQREALLKEITGTYGENLTILPPVHANWGLRHVHFGKGVFLNFNCNFVDDADIFFGDNVMVGPNCTFATANHPISPRLRKQGIQYNKPIHIGNNVWIGSGAMILSGVTIGDNSVVGAGSVVTKNVEPNTVVVGVPARVQRKITEKDDQFYDGKEIPQEIRDKYLKD